MASVYNPEEVAAVGVDDVVKEAMERFRRCVEWEANFRERFLEDLKFAEGDPDNGYQWPFAVKQNRDVDKRPCLTMNIVRQHNFQITNESRKNKSGIKIRAVGDGASKDSADLIAAVARQVEYRSNAQDAAYKLGQNYQVKAGRGWWRLATDYVDDDSFDQEVLIEPILDPLSVYIDPDCKMPDKSDARFGFVFDQVARDKFEDAYPKLVGMTQGMTPLGAGITPDDLTDKSHVRICEYFRKVDKADVLLSFIDPKDGLRKTVRKSKLPKEVWDVVSKDPLSKTRDTKTTKVEWYLIVGQQKVDETEWAGSYIPLIPVIGEESIVEGMYDCKGHTRAMKDAQRMFNYNASAQVEFVALQSKTPYIAAAKAIEEYETMWNTANQVNHSVLLFNHVDPDSPETPLPPPIRQEPPKSSTGFKEGMDTAFNQMMMTSGQWQNQMGMMGNERTGAAIGRRQEQGDTSTFHFQDNYATALKFTAKQIIDLIPKIYDTKRLMQVQSEDGEDFEVQLDPGAPQVLQVEENEHGEIVKRVLNPKIGKYDVEADVGPAYGTRRQESTDTMALLLTQAPALVGLIGDLMLKNMDIKEAKEAAARLRRMVPPQALGKGPTPAEQQLQQRLAASQGALAKALEQVGLTKVKLTGKAQMRDIDVYKARTERIKALAEMLQGQPEVLAALIGELGEDVVGETLKPIIEANKGAAEAETSPGDVPEASSADGTQPQEDDYYLTDPTRHSKYLHLGPLAMDHSPSRPSR